ncbi:hypothetical protein J6590_000446 [Homalodisca vitripennis]|nr:hypothetical protein J6590_000446 [Homalodisca vitripennis]
MRAKPPTIAREAGDEYLMKPVTTSEGGKIKTSHSGKLIALRVVARRRVESLEQRERIKAAVSH